MFFIVGNVTYYIENKSYTLSKGDILIIPPRKIHRPVIETCPNTYDRYVLWIYDAYRTVNDGVRDFLDMIDLLTDEKNTRLVSFEGKALSDITFLFDALLVQFSDSHKFSTYLADSYMVLLLNTIRLALTKQEQISEKNPEFIRDVIAYINQNVVHAPSLDDLAEKFYVSKYYLSHRFKEYTQTTIHQYILMKKINLAKEYLGSGISPQIVCEKCGFSTYSNFYKAFTAQTGISPGNYAK